MFFWNSLAFSVIQWMLAIGFLVPLPFLNLKVLGSLLLKSHLEEFEHDLASLRNESIVW